MKGCRTLNINGKLVELNRTIIMGIINSTPDSFYEESRISSIPMLKTKIEKMKLDGVDWIDVGGYSTRPGADTVSISDEKKRLSIVLNILAHSFPEIPISVDTFRAEVANWAIEQYNVAIINDISGGQIDPEILDVAASKNVPYIGMHMRGTPATMQKLSNYDNIIQTLTLYFAEMIEKAHNIGVKDIIIDPGFGFAKTLEDNYKILNHLNEFVIFEKPILVGISRKSMIYKFMNTTSKEALPGTIALHTLAILKGASIIRAHDVKEAVQMAAVVDKTLKK